MSSWSLRAHESSSGSTTTSTSMVKLWRKTLDTVCLLFNNPRDMADMFIIGLANAQLIIRVEDGRLRTVVQELSESDWKATWEDPGCGGQPVCVKSLTRDIWSPISHFFPSSRGGGGASGSGSQGSRQQQGDGDGGQQGGGDNGSGDNGGGQQGGAGEGNQQASLLSADNTFQITLLLQDCKEGQGISSSQHDKPVMLPPLAESGCVMSACLVFTFSEVIQPQPNLQHLNERFLELSVSSRFGLAGHPILLPFAEGKQWRVGVLHDQLETKIGCRSSTNVFLILNANATDLSSINIGSKAQSLESTGLTKTMQVGVSHIVTAQASAQQVSSVAHIHEHTEGRNLHAIKGTSFMVRDVCDHTRLSSGNDTLSFIALHRPPLLAMESTEAAGLPLMPSVHCSTDLGCSTRVAFMGRCALRGRGHEDHFVEMRRAVAEFNIPREALFSKNKKGKGMRLEEEKILAKQIHRVNLIINHGYTLAAYKGGHLSWYFFGTDSPSPFPDVMDMRA